MRDRPTRPVGSRPYVEEDLEAQDQRPAQEGQPRPQAQRGSLTPPGPIAPSEADPVLVYDGDCGFCTRSAHWIERRLPDDVAVVAWQSIDDLSSFDLTVDDVTSAAWWVVPGAPPQRGHLAIAASLREAGGAWGVAGRALAVPPLSWLGGPVYRLVARYRYRLPGATEACRIDDPR
jgi:predicted DCC family thiol-disulfide oxidoreductase YuxK